MMPPGGDLGKDRKVEQKVDGKKKSQSEMEQEMYSNPMLLEVSPQTPRPWWRGLQETTMLYSCDLSSSPSADEDGPDEHRWELGALPGPRRHAPLPWRPARFPS